MKAQLRPGSVYTSNGVVDFMRPLIEHYNETFPKTSALVRGDSGFAVPALYELCEKESVYYIIRLKSNAKLKPLSVELSPYCLTPAGVSHGEMDAVFAEVVPINSCGEVSQSVEEVMRHHLRFAAGA